MITLKIISPEREVLSTTTDLVELPGMMGRFEVLTDHAQLISSLTRGSIVYKDGSERRSVEIVGGFVEVRDNTVTVCIE